MLVSNKVARSIAEKSGGSLYYQSKDSSITLIHGDSIKVLKALQEEGVEADLLFADPPYHLSNGGVTCKSGKMVKVHKGDWDKSAGAVEDHKFVLEWLGASLNVLEKNGAIWVSGTHHIIFSIGYAFQELGAKILNTVIWEKAAPPPHLACRYYTHSHETILWCRKTEKAKHVYNYAFEKEANGGKQQKDIWYPRNTVDGKQEFPNHWRIGSARKAEKAFGRHPTQKPIELLDRIVRCSSNEGDLVIDPFCGSGTTGIAAIALGRNFIGIDMNEEYLELTKRRFIDLREGVLI
jgi:site-specific DNA-methyltransferase (adenine-specific)